MLQYPQTVTVSKFVSKNAYHETTYGIGVTIPAFVDYVIKIIIDPTGTELITSAWIMLPPTTDIDYNDKITLPDGSTPVIGSIAPVYNFRSGKLQYIEVYVSNVRPGG